MAKKCYMCSAILTKTEQTQVKRDICNLCKEALRTAIENAERLSMGGKGNDDKWHPLHSDYRSGSLSIHRRKSNTDKDD